MRAIRLARVVCVTAACVLSACGQAAASSDPQFQEYLQRGIASGKAGDLDSAMFAFRQALAIDPRDPEVNYYLGAVHAQKGDFAAGIEYYSLAISSDPLYVQAYSARGFAYSEQGDLVSAINDFSKAVSLMPDHAVAYYGMGVQYLRRQDPDNAIRSLNRALECYRGFLRDPAQIKGFPGLIHPVLAEAYLLKKDYAGAWRAVDTARSLGAKLDAAFIARLEAASGGKR